MTANLRLIVSKPELDEERAPNEHDEWWRIEKHPRTGEDHNANCAGCISDGGFCSYCYDELYDTGGCDCCACNNCEHSIPEASTTT